MASGRLASALAVSAIILVGGLFVWLGNVGGGGVAAQGGTCALGWRSVSGADLGARNTAVLNAVAANGPADVWAVGGYTGYSDPTGALTEHWDGQSWKLFPAPSGSFLAGVAIAAPNDAWAVGNGIIHWDGAAWTAVPYVPADVPADQQPHLELTAIAARNANDVWAVGGMIVQQPGIRGGVYIPQALHWDGQSWQPTTLPDPTLVLRSVAISGPNDVWAVGGIKDNELAILHWDGSAWSVAPTSGVAGSGRQLSAVASRAPDDVWAVGAVSTQQVQHSLIVHWNEQWWNGLDSPQPDPIGASYAAVAARARDDAWAVGAYYNNGLSAALISHWTGYGWQALDLSAMRSQGNALYGVAAGAADDAWAVGISGGGDGTLLLHYSGDCSLPTANPTSNAIVAVPIPPSLTPEPTSEPFVPAQGVADPQDPAVHYFPETQHTLRGRFREYWAQHGGLAQQGYPLTEEFQEVSDGDGKTYTVQYFERAIFELHPENQPPYDVLLSRLGAQRFAAKYPGGAVAQKPNNAAGSILFPETGKWLGGSFLLYWQQFGGLAQQGYPLSDEIQEQSELDGQTYTVQYFERAVLEWHPGNTPPYDVLLSQLGRFALTARHPATVPAPPGRATRLIASSVEGIPAAAGRYLVWSDRRGTEIYPAIYAYDTQENREFLVASQPTLKDLPATDGKTIVWVESSPDSIERLQGYDIASGRQFNIVAPDVQGDYSGVAVDGDYVYYSVRRAPLGLYSQRLSTGEVTRVSARGTMPVAAAGYVAWTEQSDPCRDMKPRPNICPFEIHLHLAAPDGSADRVVFRAGEVGFNSYHIASGKLVAAALPEISSQFLSYDIATAALRWIPQINVLYPLIGKDALVWTRYTPTGQPGVVATAIERYDPLTNSVTQLLEGETATVQAVGLFDPDLLAYVEPTMYHARYVGKLYLTSALP